MVTKTNKALSRERLLKLAWLLENLTEEFPQKKVRFDLEIWAAKHSSCHTVACACGWAGMHPWFRRRGFKTTGGSKTGILTNEITYKDYEGFTAAGEFFGLKPGDTRHIFSYLYYENDHDGRRDVARRIRAFVKDNFDLKDKIKPLSKGKSGITVNLAVTGVDDITLLEE